MIRFLTAGESHGKALTGIIEGVPAGLEIDAAYINRHMARRQKGYGRGGRMKIESDEVEILSGVRFGRTIGSPISILIRNNDWENWSDQMSVEEKANPAQPVTLPRPGHADLAGVQKFGFNDIRPVIERASARETAMRVALGSVARKLLEEFGIRIVSHVVQIGQVSLSIPREEYRKAASDEILKRSESSDVRCVDEKSAKAMIETIQTAQKDGDSVGGVFEIYTDGLPAGLGSYTHWDKKLDGVLLRHVGSIHAIKGVEIGDAFENAGSRGSGVHDEIFHDDQRGFYRKTNRSGGLEGGVTTGERLIVRAAMKPIPTLARPLQSVDIISKKPQQAHKERTDSCSVPAAAIVGEAMVALALVNPLLEKFAGDTISEIKKSRNNR